MFTRVKRNRTCKGATDKKMPQIVNLSADDGTMRRNHHFRSDLRDRILSGDKFTRLITILLLSLAEVGDMRMRNVISAFGAKIQASTRNLQFCIYGNVRLA